MATPNGVNLAVHIVKEHFGELVSKVCGYLLRMGSSSLAEIVRHTKLGTAQVKNCLLVLIQHNCVQGFCAPKSGKPDDPITVTLYMAIFDNIIHRMRFAKFITVVVKDTYPDSKCAPLLEGLLQHGRLTFKQLTERAIANKETATVRDAMRANLNLLVQAHYVERCPKSEPFIPPPSDDEARKRKRDKSTLETTTLEKRALQAATLSNAERFSGFTSATTDATMQDNATENIPTLGEKRKREAEEMDKEAEDAIVENEVLWRVNFEKFVKHLRNKACVSFKRARLGHDAGAVLEAMIESCGEQKLTDNSKVTSSLDSIFERLVGKPQGRVMNLQHVKTILEELGCEESKEGSATVYTIDLKAIVKDCQLEEVETLVLNRYGKEAFRIFRLCADKPVETGKISDVTFVDKTEAQRLLYRLCKDNILKMLKLNSTDQKPHFLWKVKKSKNWEWDRILDSMYQGALNLNLRLAHHDEQHTELIGFKVNSMTNIQKQKYKKYNDTKYILGSSLLKLDEALLLFHDFKV